MRATPPGTRTRAAPAADWQDTCRRAWKSRHHPRPARRADRPAAVREVWKALLPRRDRNRRCAAHRNRNRRTGPLRRPGDGSLCDHRRGFPLLRRPREAVPHRSAHRRRYNAGIRGGGSAQWAFRTLRRDPRNSCRSTLRRASQQHYRRSGASAVSCRAV